jgi:hypothetical protein
LENLTSGGLSMRAIGLRWTQVLAGEFCEAQGRHAEAIAPLPNKDDQGG